MTKYDGFEDSCTYSGATDRAVNVPLQGDAKMHTDVGNLVDGNHSTSRGGNTSAPGGRIIPPKSLPKGTSGNGSTKENVGRD